MNKPESEWYLSLAVPEIMAILNLEPQIGNCCTNCGPSAALFAGNLIHRLTQNHILLMQIILVEMAKKCEFISGYLDGIGGGDGRAYCRIRGANFLDNSRHLFVTFSHPIEVSQ